MNPNCMRASKAVQEKAEATVRLLYNSTVEVRGGGWYGE